MNPIRVVFALERALEVAALLPAARLLEEAGDASVTIAAAGVEAGEALSASGTPHETPGDSDWFFTGNAFDLIVTPLVAPERGGLFRWLAAEGGRRGVPALAVEIDPGIAAFDRHAARLALAGPASYAAAMAAGWGAERVAVTGLTLFDRLTSGWAAKRRETRGWLGGALGSPKIVIVSSFGCAGAPLAAAWSAGLCEALPKAGAARVAIAECVGRRSLSGSARGLAQVLGAAGCAAATFPGVRALEEILEADLLLTDDLTSALAGIAAGVRTAAISWGTPLLGPGETTPPLDPAWALALPPSLVVPAGRPGDVLAALLAAGDGELLLGGGDAAARARSFAEPGPPRAAERIAHVAREIAEERRAARARAHDAIREGNRLLAAGSTAESEASYLAALREDPFDLDAIGNLATLLAARGEDRESLEHFARLLYLAPHDETARLTSARLLARAGDHHGAARHVEEVLSAAPDHKGATLLLAEIYAAAGMPEQSLPLYEQARALGGLEPFQTAALDRAAFLCGRGEGPATAASAAPAPPKLSIVVVAYNSAGDLPACLDSISMRTTAPHEVIVVDNASSDGTRALLRSRAGIHLVECDDNVGYSRAANLGMRRARGEAVVLLNPDTVVTTGWDARMLAHALPGVGAVGPLSNYVAGAQKLELHLALPPGQFASEEVARVLGERNAGRAVETKLLIGFCLLVTREAIEKVGLLDEDLFLGNDDLEYSHRLRRAGLKLVIAGDAFVFHKGQRSFQTEPSEKTSRLVQESTDALQRKLEAIYGAGRVPPPQEIWGIGWFKPSAKAPAPAGAPPRTSIVILTWNELEYTKLCVASIAAHTPEPHELVFVDNGSTDGTVAWLESLPGAVVVKNAENRGFAAGANQGIAASRGERILLLNNDVIVTEGWLGRLHARLDSDPAIGLVGPVSNNVSGLQRDALAQYQNLEAMQAHARRTARERKGGAEEVRRLVGFCLLARAELFRSIGLFDEKYAVGNFEDDDLSIRAVLAGWRLVIAKDVFIHHYGSRTFAGNRIDYAERLEANKRYFLEKWSGILGAPAAAPGAAEAFAKAT